MPIALIYSAIKPNINHICQVIQTYCPGVSVVKWAKNNTSQFDSYGPISLIGIGSNKNDLSSVPLSGDLIPDVTCIFSKGWLLVALNAFMRLIGIFVMKVYQPDITRNLLWSSFIRPMRIIMI